MKTLLLLLFPLAVFGQALDTDLMQNNNDASGFRYYNTQTFTNSYYLEIHFRVDSSKFSSAIDYRCSGAYPEGAFLYDSAAGAAYGHFNAVVGGNQLCFIEYSRPSSGSTQKRYYQFDVDLDTCYVLTAQRSGGVSTVSLNGVVQTFNAGPGPWTWEHRANGVTLAEESQGYNDPLTFDNFPGQISYVNDNGYIIDDFTNGTLEGSATIQADLCSGNPPPPPPPEPTACELDPNSVECACETNPHPACNVCLVP